MVNIILLCAMAHLESEVDTEPFCVNIILLCAMAHLGSEIDTEPFCINIIPYYTIFWENSIVESENEKNYISV